MKKILLIIGALLLLSSCGENISALKQQVANSGTQMLLGETTNTLKILAEEEVIEEAIEEITQEVIPEEIITHIGVPESVKSVYFTAYSAASEDKINNLIEKVKNTEINSVTIDIKTVSGYVTFDMPEDNFGDIKPVSNNKISDVKALIKKLHENDIYVIGRVVVFKDKYLAQKRPDLAVKWSNGVTVWSDYKGNKYLDASATEVWDYNANIAKSAYDVGFDEINFDYVRFPTDGLISQTYYPFSNQTLIENPKWGKIMVLDKFGAGLSKNIKETHPDLIISADVFGLVTNNNGYNIGQNLESFLLYFDYVGPMIYPSHYGPGYGGYSVPDNHPYEIMKGAVQGGIDKINTLNNEISLAKKENRNIKIQGILDPAIATGSLKYIGTDKLRPWIQGFSCTRCKGATYYNRTKFRGQIEAIEDLGLNSWRVWNSASNYYDSWYNK